MNLTKPFNGWRSFAIRIASHLGCFRFTSAIALALAAVSPGFAQASGTGSIAGRVQNALSGDALVHAQVAVQGTSIIAYTDEGGQFFIGSAPSGSVTLKVSYTGLDTQTLTVNVPAGGRADTHVDLTSAQRYGDKDVVKLDKFVVESHKETDAAALAVNEQRYAANIKSVVAADEFGPMVDQNPGELLKYLPGVDVDYFANNITGVSVRGLGSDNTEINYDGLPVASMNAESVGRGMEVQYQSAADVSRVEIRKLPLPEDSANAVGGSVNFIRKSAFEASRRRISYQLLFKADGEKFTTKDMDGPKDRLVPRWRPNWNINWTEPVTKDFGFSVTLGQDDTLVNTHWSLPGWNLGTSGTNNAAAAAAIAAGQPYTRPSIFTPGMRNPLNHNAPKQQGKDYASARVDWRPMPELTLGWSVSGVKGWVQNADDIRYQWDAAATGSGDVNTYNDQTTYLGRLGGGEIFHNSPLWRDVYSPTLSTSVTSRYRKGDWEASVNGSYSESRYQYRDMADGFFNSSSTSGGTGMPNIPQTGVGSGTANPIPITINFKNVDYWGPKTIEAFTTPTGTTSTLASDYSVPVNWWSNDVTKFGGVRSRPGSGKEIITSTRSYLQHYFNFRNPLTVKLGLDWYESYRNRHYPYNNWRFISPNNTTNVIGAVNLKGRRDTEYDYPGSDRISMTRAYKLYQDHPEYYQYDAAMSARASASSNPAYNLDEKTTAPYLQLDWRTFHNRLRFVGGVRYEKVDATADGLLTDTQAAYMKYANGATVHLNDVDASGNKLVTNLSPSGARQANYVLTFGPNVLPVITSANAAGRGAPIFLASIQAAGNAQRLAYDNATGATTDQFNTAQARDPNYTLGYTNDTGTNIGRSSLLYMQTVYKEKAAHGKSSTDNYFPSLHADYDITENLKFQIGYAKTQAKLNYSNVLIPGTTRDDNVVTNGVNAGALGTINMNNTDLQPWIANNYDARLAYFTNGGQISFGLFTKRIKNIIVDLNSEPLTQADIDAFNAQFPDLNLSTGDIGYVLTTSANGGNGQLDGAELEVSQTLDRFLPHWAHGFQVIGSSTYINRKGPNAQDLGNNRAWVHKAVLNYRNRKFFGSLRWTYNGDWINNPDITSGLSSNTVYHGRQVTLAQNLVDFSLSYQVTHWANIFFSGSDIFDERRAREDQYSVRPSWSYMGSSNTFGVTYAVGVTGTF
jgi:TonB-dependent receptor